MISKRAKILSAAVASTMMFTAIEKANASFIINYQFDSAGTSSKTITAADIGTTVQVQVWGTVSIAPTDSGIVGIGFAGFRAQSQQVGGAFSAGGAGTFSPVVGVFNNTSVKGLVSDNNSDGINDLGLASGSISTNDPKARAIGNPNDGAAPGYYSDEGGWIVSATSAKVQLGSFKVAISGALGAAGATTKFNVLVPTNVSASGWFENVQGEDALNGLNPTTGSYSAGTGVSFVASGSTPPPAVFKYALTTHANATLGTTNSHSLTVIGNNGNYNDPTSSQFAPSNGTLSDYAIANANLGVGSQVPVLVLVDFNLGSSGLSMTQLETALTNAGDVGATVIDASNDSAGLRAQLLAQYPGFSSSNSLLLEFLTAPGATANGLHFGFDAGTSGVSVVQAIAVPEPASMGLLALAGMGLLARRRR